VSSTKELSPSPASSPSTLRATPAHAATHIRPQSLGESRSILDDNSALYELGRRIADRISRLTAPGEGPRAALQRVVAGLSLAVTDACSAVRFQEAVDLIVGNVGEGARAAILAGGRHLSPQLIMQIGRTHPDRQRFALAQIAQGRHPLAKPRDGTAPPYDTLGYGEIRSRIARTAGSLDRVAGGLAAATAGEWPTEAKLRQMTDHLGRVRKSCSALRAMLEATGTRAETGRALARRTHTRRPGRPPGSPTSFRPGGALAFVAAARGIAEKNARDLPRLLRESPLMADDRASLLDRLRLLNSAAQRLTEVIAGHIASGPPRSPARRSGPTGHTSAGIAGRRRGVRWEEATEGPTALGGTYTVHFFLDVDAVVTVGALGTFGFRAGFYAYVGSAFGPGGVRARTTRHRTQHIVKKKWNIDHMKPPLRAIAMWWTNDPIKRECSWSAVLAATPGFSCPAAGFGSHDCRINRADGFGVPGGRLCEAHFYHSVRPPDVDDFARRLGQLVPGHATVYYQSLAPAGEVEAVHNFPQAAAKSPGSRRPSSSGTPPRPASAPEAERP